MSEDAFLTCVYYYGLPEFPKNCTLVGDNSLFVRDVLVSNPHNPHVEYGGQYDPHYEHNFAPQYKMCSRNTRRKIKAIIDGDLYDKVYLLFRTTKVKLSDANSQCISGYYNIDLQNVSVDPDYGEPVLYAKEAIFVNEESAIDLSDFLARNRNRRFPFSIETRNGSFKKQLETWTRKIEAAENRLKDYIDMTKQLERLFKCHEFEKGMYPTCEACAETDRCYLAKRIRKKGKLRDQLPNDIACRIDGYFKRVTRGVDDGKAR